MKITLFLLTVLLFACCAPRYTYYFNQAGHPAPGVTASGQPLLSNPAESVAASASPEPIPLTETLESAPASTPTPVNAYPVMPGLSKSDRKEARKELRSAVREIKKIKTRSFLKPASGEETNNPRNNVFAIAGFVLSLLGWFVLWPLIILGVIFSAIGLKSEKRGLAIAGIIIGIAGLVVLMLASQHGAL